MSERIRVRNPNPDRAGGTVDRVKYEVVKWTVLDAIESQGEIHFKDLRGEVEKRVPGDFDASPGWYTTTVKLDLEARYLIEGIPDSKPQRLRIA